MPGAEMHAALFLSVYSRKTSFLPDVSADSYLPALAICIIIYQNWLILI